MTDAIRSPRRAPGGDEDHYDDAGEPSIGQLVALLAVVMPVSMLAGVVLTLMTLTQFGVLR